MPFACDHFEHTRDPLCGCDLCDPGTDWDDVIATTEEPDRLPWEANANDSNPFNVSVGA